MIIYVNLAPAVCEGNGLSQPRNECLFLPLKFPLSPQYFVLFARENPGQNGQLCWKDVALLLGTLLTTYLLCLHCVPSMWAHELCNSSPNPGSQQLLTMLVASSSCEQTEQQAFKLWKQMNTEIFVVSLLRGDRGFASTRAWSQPHVTFHITQTPDRCAAYRKRKALSFLPIATLSLQ